jgi:undecaprenyl-diphosphatase
VWALAVASVPAAAAGLLLEGMISRLFASMLLVGGAFWLTAAVLWSTRRLAAGSGEGKGERGGVSTRSPSPRQALGVGVAQAVAIIPGISRSGSTVAAGLWLGIEPLAAAEFSFLLSLPAILGAALLESRHLTGELARVGAAPLAVACVAAAASGVLAIRWLLWLLRRRAFHRFAPYLAALGAITVALALTGSP